MTSDAYDDGTGLIADSSNCPFELPLPTVQRGGGAVVAQEIPAATSKRATRETQQGVGVDVHAAAKHLLGGSGQACEG